MRFILILSAVLIGLGALGPTSEAAPTAPKPVAVSSNIVPVANGCGPGWHWRHGHRNVYGVWIRGHCVPN